jgi:hypothetical protein
VVEAPPAGCDGGDGSGSGAVAGEDGGLVSGAGASVDCGRRDALGGFKHGELSPFFLGLEITPRRLWL